MKTRTVTFMRSALAIACAAGRHVVTIAFAGEERLTVGKFSLPRRGTLLIVR